MHPFPIKAMTRFRNALAKNVEGEISVLDVGSRDVNGSFRHLFEPPKWTYFGLDLVEGKNVDIVVKDPYSWSEIQSDSYDAVISGSAFEHMEYPWLVAQEIARVLKMYGMACLIMPSVGPKHNEPQDCYRFFPDGAAAIVRWGGLEVISSTRNEPGHQDWSEDWRDSIWMDVCVLARKNPKGYSL